MLNKTCKRMLAFGLSAAMVVSSLSALPGKDVSAAKKATVKLSKSKLTLSVGTKKTLKVKKTNVKKVKSVTWKSSKKAVATVSKKGVVTAKKAGTAKIKAVVKYIPKGKKKAVKKTLKCTVKVVKLAEQTAAVTATVNPATAAPSTQPAVSASAAPAESASAAPGASDVPGESETPVDTLVPFESADPSVTPTITPVPTATPTLIPAPTSNVTEGETRTKTLSDGTEITIKDNGTVRKDVTAQYVADNEMKTGINLGNTLEATYSINTKLVTDFTRTDYDKAWSQPETTRAYIECLHEYGINTLRIPVAWSNGDKDDGTYTIDPVLLDRVEEVANYALDLGMYVVINDHWDNQWWGQFGACKWEYSTNADGDEVKTKVVDEDTRAEAWVRYERYWTQIAERFQDYSDHLILEGANEELGDRLNDSIGTNGKYKGYEVSKDETKAVRDEAAACSGNLTEDECYEMVNKINQKFVDIVRGTGGNNSYRFLLIPGYNTDLTATGKTDADGNHLFKMPEDTEENGTSKLFLSVHYYTPSSYCLESGSGNYTEEDAENTVELFKNLQDFSDAGYATIIGECGVCAPSSVVGGVIDWYTDVFTQAKNYHAVPIVWDTGAYFDRTTPSANYKDMADFWNCWNNATGSTEGITRQTGGGKDTSGQATVEEYIDKELWEKAGLHAYLFYQTTNWNYRDAYAPLKNLSSGKNSWNYISNADEDTIVTDVDITEDGATYTVSIEDLSYALSGNAFNMLGISTNIDKGKKKDGVYGDLDIKVTATSIKFDGKEQLDEPKELIYKSGDQYAEFMAINTYSEGEGKDGLQSDYALGVMNENNTFKIPSGSTLPTESMEITFTITGISKILDDIASGDFVNPETGLSANQAAETN